MDLSSIISLYFQGDNESRKSLEEFLYLNSFWNEIILQLKFFLKYERTHLQFLLLLIIRRLSLFQDEDISSPSTITSTSSSISLFLLEQLLQFKSLSSPPSSSSSSSSDLLFDNLSRIFALLTLKQSKELFFNTFNILQEALSDSPLLLMKYITELAASQTNDNEKNIQILQG